ncbi:hypothetical protein ACQ4M3_07925 [Leptolyngbya sp. AN03gr2]|uniref:hypothetical protein n=1 Tax=unclassified Leptolyngbya TaxID=2650499 RepID=UPI003D319F26
MQYARLTKFGGQLIDADHADYEDYKGILRCPECGEPVFLRKSHLRGKQSIANTFVHHKAIPEVSKCELRVGSYGSADVEAAAARARGQRLRTLKISLWKYIKTTIAIDLKNWSTYVKDAKHTVFRQVVEYAEQILKTHDRFILDDTLPRMADLLQQRDARIGVSAAMQHTIDQFLVSRSRDWRLHCLIAQEALSLLLTSPSMSEIRHRLCCCLCHPTTIQSIPGLLDLNPATLQWQELFFGYLTLEITFVFLAIDWFGIWDLS